MIPRNVVATADEIYRKAGVNDRIIQEGVANDLVCVSPWNADTGKYDPNYDFVVKRHMVPRFEPRFWNYDWYVAAATSSSSSNVSSEARSEATLVYLKKRKQAKAGTREIDYQDGINFAHDVRYAVAKIDFGEFKPARLLNEEAALQSKYYVNSYARKNGQTIQKTEFTDALLQPDDASAGGGGGIRCFIMYQNLNRSREWLRCPARVRIPVAHLRPFAATTNFIGTDTVPPIRPCFDLAVRDLVYKVVQRELKGGDGNVDSHTRVDDTLENMMEIVEAEESAKSAQGDDDGGTAAAAETESAKVKKTVTPPPEDRRFDKRLFMVVDLRYDSSTWNSTDYADKFTDSDEYVNVYKERMSHPDVAYIVPVEDLDADYHEFIPPLEHDAEDPTLRNLNEKCRNGEARVEKCRASDLRAFRNVDNCIPVPREFVNPSITFEGVSRKHRTEFKTKNTHCAMIGTNPLLYASFCRYAHCPRIAFSSDFDAPALCYYHRSEEDRRAAPPSRYIIVPPPNAPAPPPEERRRRAPCDIFGCQKTVPSETSLEYVARCFDHGWGRCYYPGCTQSAAVPKRANVTAFCEEHTRLLRDQISRVMMMSPNDVVT